MVADGVLEKEVAKIRPIRRDRLHSGLGIKQKHGIAVEVRNTNLRFSMIMTTPTNRCQKVGVTGSHVMTQNPSQATLDGAKKSRMHVAACAFHSSQIAIAHYQSFILRGDNTSQGWVNHRY